MEYSFFQWVRLFKLRHLHTAAPPVINAPYILWTLGRYYAQKCLQSLWQQQGEEENGDTQAAKVKELREANEVREGGSAERERAREYRECGRGCVRVLRSESVRARERACGV